MNIIKFKDIDITYDELEAYFKEMKDNRNDRETLLETIAYIHNDILIKYSKFKPPIDDISLNTLTFKSLTDINKDLSYNNYSSNNTLFHLLNNIYNKRKEMELLAKIENLEFKSMIHSYMHLVVIIVVLTYRFSYKK